MSRPRGATREGVHNLAGNVLEWVADWYGTYNAGAVTNPTGPESNLRPESPRRVVRGGAWLGGVAQLARCQPRPRRAGIEQGRLSRVSCGVGSGGTTRLILMTIRF